MGTLSPTRHGREEGSVQNSISTFSSLNHDQGGGKRDKIINYEETCSNFYSGQEQHFWSCPGLEEVLIKLWTLPSSLPWRVGLRVCLQSSLGFHLLGQGSEMIRRVTVKRI